MVAVSERPAAGSGWSRPEQGGTSSTDDPVRARRRQIARWSLLANRVGYLCFGVAIAVFVFGFAIGFTPATVSVVVVAMVVGSVLLAPAIVLGYAVKAAEREDREHGR
jgi:hypothetical protein